MHPPPHRSLALSLALCAMLLRALLPAGWMPNASPEAGASPFVICSLDGTHTGGKAPDAPEQERAHAPCAFAAMAPLAPPALDRVAWAAPTVAGTIDRAVFHDGFTAEIFHRPQSARAPPAAS